jgi:hypothetical protein
VASPSYNEIENLEAQATALIQELKREVRLLVAARQAGDLAAVDAWRKQIAIVGASYNAVVQRLRELEGPSSSMLFLDRVGDVVISGVKAGASFTLEATEAVAGAAGRAVAAAALPVFVPLVLGAGLLLWLAGKSGALRVRGAVAV